MNTQTQAATPLVFFQLQKVDEEKRLVYGRAVQEVPDRVGEIFDYESSVPFFKAWAASQFEASLGKSNGNVRAMHKDVAAGIIIPGGLKFHDDERAIDLCAHVTDDQEWAKVNSGTYTGFSIGGRYAKKWEDPDLKKTRYTADPSEVSLVDRPCIPTATFFEIQKADGTLEKRDFVVEKKFEFPKDAKKGDKVTDDDGDEHQFDGEAWQKMEKEKKSEAAADLSKTEGAQSVVASPAGAETIEEYDVEAKPEEVDEFIKLLAATKTPFAEILVGLRKVAAREDVNPKEGKEKYGSVKFADAKNKKYPIDTEEHIRAAWNYINKAKNAGKYDAKDVESIKAAIVSAWKEKIDKDGPPSASEKAVQVVGLVKAIESEVVRLAKREPTKRAEEFIPAATANVTRRELRKNLSCCAEFAQLLNALCSLQQRIEYEEEIEDDDTELPARMMNAIVDLGNVLSEMIKEEVAEVYEDKEATPGVPSPVMAMAEAIADLKKRAEAMRPLIKYGARNSKADQNALQSAHDALNKAGARCNKAFLFADDDPGAVGADKGTVNEGANRFASPDTNIQDKSVKAGDLAKVDDLTKALDTANGLIKQLQADVEALKKQPAAPRVRLRAIAKGEELTTGEERRETEPVRDAHGEVHKVATTIKELHQTGGEDLYKFR